MKTRSLCALIVGLSLLCGRTLMAKESATQESPKSRAAKPIATSTATARTTANTFNTKAKTAAQDQQAQGGGPFARLFYGCDQGSFAIVGNDGWALFKWRNGAGQMIGVHAKLKYYATSGGHWWYESNHNNYRFAFAQQASSCGCCGECCCDVYVYYGWSNIPIFHCCACRTQLNQLVDLKP